MLIMIITTALVMAGCDGTDNRVDIYATVYPVEFLVQEIVGTRLKVGSVYPRGKDVHDYESSPRDIMKMAGSRMIFYLGLELEAFIERAKTTTLKDVPTIEVSIGVDPVELNQEDFDEPGDDVHVHDDPHVWLDPNRMIIMAANVIEGILLYLSPSAEDREYYQSNYDNLVLKLQELDNEFREAVNNDNIKNKIILVDHDAYIYWTVAYGIERIKMRNHNDSSDVVPQDMQQKIAAARRYGIKHVIIAKNEAEAPIISQYLRELGLNDSARAYLHTLGTITKTEERSGLDYFTIMRANLATLIKVFPKYNA